MVSSLFEKRLGEKLSLDNGWGKGVYVFFYKKQAKFLAQRLERNLPLGESRKVGASLPLKSEIQKRIER